MKPAELLKTLIAIPSFSREESDTAAKIMELLYENGCHPKRSGNNVWVVHDNFDASKPTLLLNSHHDTVKPNNSWTFDPFQPLVKEGKLYGLGSNDAGGALVCLMLTFLHFKETELPFNLLFAATAEEEISGKNGIEMLLNTLPPIEMGIVGEPTLLHMAVAEKGLMVVDAVVKGKAGHAARKEGENAIYKAIEDISVLRAYQFDFISEWLGPVNINVTQINAGIQHNIVPDECRYVIDVRLNEKYTHEAVLKELNPVLHATLTPRSTRLRASGISMNHPLVKAGMSIGLRPYGSPTLSDQSLMPFPTIKIGPGDSARSHTADEFIRIDELEDGLSTYIKLIKTLADEDLG